MQQVQPAPPSLLQTLPAMFPGGVCSRGLGAAQMVVRPLRPVRDVVHFLTNTDAGAMLLRSSSSASPCQMALIHAYVLHNAAQPCTYHLHEGPAFATRVNGKELKAVCTCWQRLTSHWCHSFLDVHCAGLIINQEAFPWVVALHLGVDSAANQERCKWDDTGLLYYCNTMPGVWEYL